MGARQSYLYIFLEAMDETYGKDNDEFNGYRVISSKGVLDECDSFEVVTHKIDNWKGDPKSYDIYIYDSRSIPTKASYIFGYCSPRVDTHVAKEVRAYYSVLSPHSPLAITFVRDHGHKHHCAIDKLRDAGWDWASSISKYTSGNLVELLKTQYTNLAWDRTIQFTSGKENKNIMGRRQEIDNEKYYRVIFAPDGDGSILGILCMYCTDPQSLKLKCLDPPTDKNQIDLYYLSDLINDFFAGLVLYFVRNGSKPPDTSQEKDYDNTLLLVEFCKPCGTTSFKRMDKKGCWWSKDKLKYTKHQDRVDALKKINDDADKNTFNTVILDKKDKYICGRVVESHKNQDTYNKYTHKFDNAQSPNLIYQRSDPGIEIIQKSGIKAINVDVYYLKLGEKDDDKPFLIVFENGDIKSKKVYHFKNTGKFKDWVEFTDVGKLDDKLVKISNRGKCTKEIGLLRQLVYQLLTTDDVPDPVKPADGPPEERPGVVPLPPPPPEPPNWLLIIGSSVGAFVFVCLLAIGYGIYWYNTTIKLLT